MTSRQCFCKWRSMAAFLRRWIASELRGKPSRKWECNVAEERIGFVGVGRMGARMAGRLLAGGLKLTICDTNADALRPLAERGAQVVDSAAAVASACEIVFVS